MTLDEVRELLCANGMTTELNVHKHDWGYAASFERICVQERGVTCGAYGRGANRKEAIADYAQQLGGKKLLHSLDGVRRTLTLPGNITVS